MNSFVWCKNEECRVPIFRCGLCRDKCYAGTEADPALDRLVKSGKFKERYMMKRKGVAAVQDQSALVEDRESEPRGDGAEGITMGQTFLLDDGRLRPISPSEYTTSTLYQVVESYEVECRLVRPEEPGSLVFDGKKPSKKTVPILIARSGESTVLESWDALESRPELLAEALEVVGAAPVRQVFVLKRK